MSCSHVGAGVPCQVIVSDPKALHCRGKNKVEFTLIPCMAPVRRLVLDVLKPHDPPLVEFTTHLAELDSVDGVTSSLIELDKEVQNIKLTFEGPDVDFESIEETIEHLGGTVHSIDQVACGEHTVEERRTLQDR